MKEYKVYFPGFKFMDYIIARGETEYEAMQDAQRTVDEWSFVIDRSRNGTGISIGQRCRTKPMRHSASSGRPSVWRRVFAAFTRPAGKSRQRMALSLRRGLRWSGPRVRRVC